MCSQQATIVWDIALYSTVLAPVFAHMYCTCQNCKIIGKGTEYNSSPERIIVSYVESTDYMKKGETNYISDKIRSFEKLGNL
jgi:hypothetical protein